VAALGAVLHLDLGVVRPALGAVAAAAVAVLAVALDGVLRVPMEAVAGHVVGDAARRRRGVEEGVS
jgi:hypothetical protein